MLLSRNVSLCFWATVSALVCLVCSSTVVRNYDDDDDDKFNPRFLREPLEFTYCSGAVRERASQL